MVRLQVRDEEFICHDTEPEVVRGVARGVATVEGRVIVQATGPDGSHWVGERVLKIRLRKGKPGD